jgi:UDP-glucose 4-epimerase
LPERCERDPAAAERVNVGGALAVFGAAREGGVRRVVYASSRAVYGQHLGEHGFPGYLPLGEDAPRVPVPPMRIYGATKVFCEEVGCQYADLGEFEFVALRFASIIGIGKEARHGALPIQGRMIENAVAGKPTAIERGGEERDDMIYVKDMARAVSLALSAPEVARAYNIGSGRTSSLEDLATAVRAAVPGAEISIGPGRDYLGCGPLYGQLDISRACADLGYEPEHDLAATVTGYIRDLRG